METKTALDALRALGQEHRIAAFRRLVRAGPSGLPVGELRKLLGIPPATLTAHLNVLRQAGLIGDERQGRVIRLRASFAQMNALLDFLAANCCADDAAACPPASTSSCHTSERGSEVARATDGASRIKHTSA